ncbi:ROK family transcriptional regulator [Planomonospora parontospora]|uniref:ROK family transcriptional regulator n=1 Tax=Planomonospora parontospora TaxID=58119 RepID=UPI0016703D95|nr:ROK family transcriptional regulator [Planomonospora parontospora]GGL55917.1 sugar kinase [Planomonospora parontospora subsp. antibiotica]GII18737.1 sugar kinase [Planomonospora parontospora subsp. antibiotica]
MTQAVRHDSMRARNLGVVLGEVRRSGPVTRAALAEMTGLTKTTVSKMVADLLAAGMVTETGVPSRGERGRPGTAVALSGGRVAALGLEINVDYLSACVVDLTLEVRLRRAQAVDNRAASPVETLRHLRELAREAVDEVRSMGLVVAGSTLAVPGPVDDGLVHSAPNLGWRDVHVGELLDDLLAPSGPPFPPAIAAGTTTGAATTGATTGGTAAGDPAGPAGPAPVPLPTVDNEANLAALGELWFGSGHRDFLHVSGEIGIGAGLVVGGALFRGSHGLAGELGHVVVFPDGPPCRCGGRGCLEQYAGQEALLRAAGAGTVEELTGRLRDGDAAALTACERAGHALGLALTSAVHLFDPGTIVLGGVFAPLFPWISGAVRETTAARLAAIRDAVPDLAVSRLGGDAATLGAAGQVIHRIIADPVAHLAAT